jgi:hypothetical protein
MKIFILHIVIAFIASLVSYTLFKDLTKSHTLVEIFSIVLCGSFCGAYAALSLLRIIELLYTKIKYNYWEDTF